MPKTQPDGNHERQRGKIKSPMNLDNVINLKRTIPLRITKH